MVKNHRLAKSINDAGWYLFREWLKYFAIKFGKVAVSVAPHYTSQECSNCGSKVKKSLSVRTHICKCGATLDRDENAAINILVKALKLMGYISNTVGHTEINACGETTLYLNLETVQKLRLLGETRIPIPLGWGVSNYLRFDKQI